MSQEFDIVEVADLPGVDQDAFQHLVGAGCAIVVLADTILQAAAAIAVFRQHRHAEPVADRRAVFDRVVDINTLTQAETRGTA